MKEELDEHWIDKIKDLLEDYSPSDSPEDWKLVKRKMNRKLYWGTRILLFLRRPWIYGVIFGSGILVGFLLFHHPDQSGNYLFESQYPNTLQVPDKETSSKLVEPSIMSKSTMIPAGSGKVSGLKYLTIIHDNESVKPFKTGIVERSSETVMTVKTSANADTPATTAISSISIKESASATNDSSGEKGFLNNTHFESPPATPTDSTLQQTAPNSADKKIFMKTLKTIFDFSSINLSGDPWKAGIGYEYLPMINADTSKGFSRGFRINFDKQVANNFWFGSGLIIGRTELSRIMTYWVRDWSKPDSLGTVYLRDSSISYQRWHNQIAIPVRATFDLFKTRNFALPVTAGVTFGWAYSQGHLFKNDGLGVGGSGGSTNEFTGFITGDFSIGYEVFYFRGLSAILSAEYRRMIAGQKSFGYRQNFLGGKILLNFDFDRRQWK